MFDNKAGKWLKVWLNSQLKFISYINKRVKRICIAKIQIKDLIWRISVANLARCDTTRSIIWSRILVEKTKVL